VFGAFDGNITLTLFVPAIAVTLVFFAILFGVPESEPVPGRKLDIGGFVILTLGLLLITSGLTFLRINGPETWWVWAFIVIGVLVFIPFAMYEKRQPDPAIDLKVLKQPTMWPVQLTAGLFGIAVLGAQAPLSTYAGTDPAEVGYGLGLSTGMRSILIGVYLISMIVGAVLFPLLSKRTSPRVALIVAAFFVAIGYLMFLPFHDTTPEVLINMIIAGIGSGALVAALPAAAAAAAPRGQTGIAAGLTNTTKTIGGSFASAVFGTVLAAGVVTAGTTAASLAGYFTVWTICGVGALVAAILLFFVPKLAFADVEADLLPEAEDLRAN
jgi:predicted MFS family arabinose efflux permease